MTTIEKNLDTLQNLESTVVEFWRRQPDLGDSVVARAYESAYERYRAQARGHQPKPPALNGPERELYDALVGICELRLGRGSPAGLATPIPVDELVDCLRELRRSVERHLVGGRQGYLKFIGSFLP